MFSHQNVKIISKTTNRRRGNSGLITTFNGHYFMMYGCCVVHYPNIMFKNTAYSNSSQETSHLEETLYLCHNSYCTYIPQILNHIISVNDNNGSTTPLKWVNIDKVSFMGLFCVPIYHITYGKSNGPLGNTTEFMASASLRSFY